MNNETRVPAEVESYWLEAGLSTIEAAEMRSELEQHLTEAAAEGRSVDDVVGDTAAFAVNWAEARRRQPVARWEDVCKVDRQEKNGRPGGISSHTGSALLR